jgi:uncharacterized protein (DUF486 family)
VADPSSADHPSTIRQPIAAQGLNHRGRPLESCVAKQTTAPSDPSMPVVFRTVLLLTASNVFMTFAWYGHLRTLGDRRWYVAAIASWLIALFEYLLQVPANRIGFTVLTLPQLKIIQEVITLAVFVPFAVYYMRQPLKLDYLWAALCILAAVYFVFRSHGGAG